MGKKLKGLKSSNSLDLCIPFVLTVEETEADDCRIHRSFVHSTCYRTTVVVEKEPEVHSVGPVLP